MIKKKIVLGICCLCLLNGCVQSTAFLGPAYTLGTTGNIYQAGITYSSNHAISSLTGKSTGENIKNILQVKDKDTDLFIDLCGKCLTYSNEASYNVDLEIDININEVKGDSPWLTQQ